MTPFAPGVCKASDVRASCPVKDLVAARRAARPAAGRTGARWRVDNDSARIGPATFPERE